MTPAANPGLLEDAASRCLESVAEAVRERNVAGAKAALEAMRRQGWPPSRYAAVPAESMAAFATVRRAGGLTARAHSSLRIAPTRPGDPVGAVARVVALATV